MITVENLPSVLTNLGFTHQNNVYTKTFPDFECKLVADFNERSFTYPSELRVNDKTTCNFSADENFVVFECVHRLIKQGYHPKHIELERKWQLGHSQKSGKADICVKDNDGNIILIIECKTAGSEYDKARRILETDSRNQLFSYLQQATSTQFLALYSSDFDTKVTCKYYLISVTDNDELLGNNKKLKGYKDTATTEEKWTVWRKTYDGDYATLGLFENNKAYDIGKKVFQLEDLNPISNKDIQGKYHEFATILRQYNVSGRENAFDKLVNLFLCKVTDEIKNPKKLNFYWKGKAFDNPFDFQDRLQALYKDGMKEYLGDKITYIANNKLDEAFGIFSQKANVAKDTIKDYFKQLKFFSNNDFAFIDVHNEKLFYQNFEVLLKVCKMIQDLRLTDSEENQFLGDMFEGFLDAGVKQSEGQFFTPMPIVKFIINSLPDKQTPRVLDYACGAGHFLNEYFIKNRDSDIVGVEKEYRLSKVAKVSSFMYGSKMDIIHNDALAHNAHLLPQSFDVLIANPPYSVTGFLATLSEEDRKKYTLSEEVKDHSTANAIECFFIERAVQLLDKDAVAGIIVPSSILNKETPALYTKTRELLLKHFNIIAIAEFGSGTFGKTGTNTVTLFLQRRDPSQHVPQHYQNMVNEWFNGDLNINKALKDEHLLNDYCRYSDFNETDYHAFLQGSLTDDLLKTEMFSEYQKAFNKTYKAPATKVFKAKSQADKEAHKQAEFLTFLKDKEREKLYYFCLAKAQTNDVVIVKSPSDSKEIKKFLGYEWSNRKGNEGIQYITTEQASISKVANADDENAEIDSKKQEQLKSINTPLYNPNNADDDGKINKIIKDNFNGLKTPIADDLKPFVSRANLVDMLDFDRVDFGKTLTLTPKKKAVTIESKYPLVRLGEITEINAQSFDPHTQEDGEFIYIDIDSIGKGTGKINYNNIIKGRNAPSRARRIVKNDSVVISTVRPYLKGFAYVKSAKENCIFSTGFAVLKGTDKVLSKYLYLLFMFSKDLMKQIEQAMPKSSYPSINKSDIENLVIALPPLTIQQKIIEEIDVFETESNKNQQEVEQLRNAIEYKFKNLVFHKYPKIKIGDLTETSSGGTPLKSNNEFYVNGTIPWINSGEIKQGNIYQTENFITQKGLENSSAKLFPVNTILLAMYGATAGQVGILKIEATTNQAVCGIFPNEKYLPEFLFYHLKCQYQQLLDARTGIARDNLSQAKIREFTIFLPPLDEQQKIVAEIEKLEQKITELETQLANIPTEKAAVLKRHL